MKDFVQQAIAHMLRHWITNLHKSGNWIAGEHIFSINIPTGRRNVYMYFGEQHLHCTNLLHIVSTLPNFYVRHSKMVLFHPKKTDDGI